MAKIKGSYSSLVRGVSEQVPHERLSGQHYEQVNMVSDPIRGLIRRRGSRYLADQGTSAPTPEVDGVIKGFREYTMKYTGEEYAVLYSTRPSTNGNIERVVVYDKEREAMVPVVATSEAQSRMNRGISTVTSAGRYLLAGIQGHIPASTGEQDMVAATGNQAVAWVKGGAYSRTYTLRVGNKTAEYTTPKSYYDGTLDTSDISYDDNEYQKKVNDRVHAYNTAVNQHIASAQEAIQPEKIAEKLKDALVAKGISAKTKGTHVVMDVGTDQLTGDDGGNGGFLSVTHREVGGLDELTKIHHPGAVVRVAVSSDDVYYVRADEDASVGDGWAEVTWKEAAGVSAKVEDAFLVGTIHDGTMYIGHSPSTLESLLPTGHGIDVPEVIGREAGDEDTNPSPGFFKRPISYMTVFQDRLVVCSGANVFMSVPGDYFNWFRSTVLRVEPDDPVEVYALGAEGDTIRGGSLIDRNLILLGDKLHYAISGREAIAPTNAIVTVQASIESTTAAQPKGLGGLLFYGQYQGGVTQLHQMQVGAFADSFDSFSVTQQITEYIKGRPRQLVTSSQPNMVLMTTEGNETGMYVFTFLDSPGQEQRLFDSWSRWEWDDSLGKLIAVTAVDEGFVVFTLRECNDGWNIVADEFSRNADIGEAPYLDSRQKYTEITQRASPLNAGSLAGALTRSHQRRYVGRPLDRIQELLDMDGVAPEDVQVGTLFDSYYEPTPPFPRDKDDAPKLSGRIVLASLGVTLQQSAGLEVDRQEWGATDWTRIKDDTGFRVADPLSPLGKVPVTNRRVTVYVGREIREHRLRLRAKTWVPLNIATVEWEMQVYNRG